MKIFCLLCFCTVAMSFGCSSSGKTATEEEEVKSDTSEVLVGKPYLDSIRLNVLESFPVRVHVIVDGHFADGCTYLGNITQMLEGNVFNIEITTHRPEDRMCTEALVPFQETIPLEVEGLEKGEYLVRVNNLETSFRLEQDNVAE